MSKASKKLNELLYNEGDPDTFARLKSHFLQFENVYETPELEGWSYSVSEGDKLLTWPGARRIYELLNDLYIGTSEMQTVRTVPCQILSQAELQSPDHKAAREYLKNVTLKLRESIRNLNLKSPYPHSVIENGSDATHPALHLARSTFGIAAAFEDYAAMIESLAILGEIYTYLLANPLQGIAHAEDALNLLTMRYYKSVRSQDLPGNMANPFDYARELIGNVYYALARMRREQGQPNGALAAYEASLAVRGH